VNGRLWTVFEFANDCWGMHKLTGRGWAVGQLRSEPTDRYGSNVIVDSSLRRMPAITLGDLTGCTAYQQSFEAVNIALDEVRRSWKVGLEVQLTLVHRSDWAGPAKKR